MPQSQQGAAELFGDVPLVALRPVDVKESHGTAGRSGTDVQPAAIPSFQQPLLFKPVQRHIRNPVADSELPFNVPDGVKSFAGREAFQLPAQFDIKLFRSFLQNHFPGFPVAFLLLIINNGDRLSQFCRQIKKKFFTGEFSP